MRTAPTDQLLHPVQQLVEAVGSAVRDAGDPLLVGLSDGELDRVMVSMEAVISQLLVREAALVTEARSRNRAGVGGAATHTRWLALLLRADPRDAARRLRNAAVLDGAAADPVTAPLVTDVRDGESLLPQALIAARAVADLPSEVSAEGRAAATVVMRQAARDLDPERLSRVAARLVEVADPDGADARLAALLERQDRDAHELRSFHLGRPVNGMVRGRFTLPTADAEVVRAAIEALAGPRRTTDTPNDDAGPDNDAGAGDSASPEGNAEFSEPDHPHGTGDAPGSPFGNDVDGPDGAGESAGPDDPDGAGESAGPDDSPWGDRETGPDGPPDPRTPTQRRADAFTDLVSRALGIGLPESGGHRPNVYLTIDLERLRAAHPGETLDGTPVAPSVLRRTACDAGIIPAVLGGRGQPLDVGQETRTVPTGLRRALTLRDRGCAFPGCDRPPGWTDAHHIVHWADDGPTRLDNLVLLCRHHHRVAHREKWTVRIRPDGRPEWQPPPWVAPPGTWLTNDRR